MWFLINLLKYKNNTFFPSRTFRLASSKANTVFPEPAYPSTKINLLSSFASITLYCSVENDFNSLFNSLFKSLGATKHSKSFLK